MAVRHCVWGVLGLFLCSRVVAHSEVRLKTSEVALVLEARSDGPCVKELLVPGQAPWMNRAVEQLPDHAEVTGHTVPLKWKLVPKEAIQGDHRVAVVSESDYPYLRLTWAWDARAPFGPLEHQIRIENLGHSDIWLPFLDSYQFDFAVTHNAALRHFYVEKGAGTPSPVGTHDVSLGPGYSWEGTSSTYAHPGEGEEREIIPWFVVQRVNASRDGWYVGIEFSGRTRLAIRREGESIKGVAGLNSSPGPFRTRIPSGDAFETPQIFLGGFRGGPDGAGNILRRWVRKVLTNPLTWKNPDYPLLVNNSWGSGISV